MKALLSFFVILVTAATAQPGHYQLNLPSNCVANIQDKNLRNWFHTQWSQTNENRVQRVCQAMTSIGGIERLADFKLLDRQDVEEMSRLGKLTILDRKKLIQLLSLTKEGQPACEAASEQQQEHPKREWTQIPTANRVMKHVAMNKHNVMFAINDKDQILVKLPTGKDDWTQIQGGLKQIDVGGEFSNTIVGVNVHHHVWTKTFHPVLGNPTSKWVAIPGQKLSHVSICGNGAVWGVNAAGRVYFRASVELNVHWTEVPQRLLKQITCDSVTNQVYGVDKKEGVYARRGITLQNWKGATWDHVHSGLVYVTGGNGVVMGVDADQHMYEMSDAGWKHWVGLFVRIEVSPNGNLVGVDEDGLVYSKKMK